jgi:hypothetical protein
MSQITKITLVESIIAFVILTIAKRALIQNNLSLVNRKEKREYAGDAKTHKCRVPILGFSFGR